MDKNRTVSPLRAIDGTGDSGPAPRPKRGLMRALYDTVEALGESTESKINKYLPAAIETTSQVVTRKKLQSALYACVYNGYLVTHSGKYRVAPRSYYQARQEILKEHKRNPANPARNRGDDAPKHEVTVVRPMWHWVFILAVAGSGLLAGFAVGLMVGLMGSLI